MGVVSLPKMVKPDTVREATSRCSGSGSPGWEGTAGVERSTEEPERPDRVRRAPGHGVASDRRREYITVAGHGRESEGAIVAMKRGNSRGAKDPCRTNVFIRSKEIRLDERPTTEDSGQPLNQDQPLD